MKKYVNVEEQWHTLQARINLEGTPQALAQLQPPAAARPRAERERHIRAQLLQRVRHPPHFPFLLLLLPLACGLLHTHCSSGLHCRSDHIFREPLHTGNHCHPLRLNHTRKFLSTLLIYIGIFFENCPFLCFTGRDCYHIQEEELLVRMKQRAGYGTPSVEHRAHMFWICSGYSACAAWKALQPLLQAAALAALASNNHPLPAAAARLCSLARFFSAPHRVSAGVPAWGACDIGVHHQV